MKLKIPMPSYLVNQRASKKLRLQELMVVRGDGLVRIPLTLGKWAVVDENDYDLVKGYKWYAEKNGQTFYARSFYPNNSRKMVHMHRLILGLDAITDHKDGDGLNNRRSNLRSCSVAQNRANQRLRKDNTTGLKGIVAQPDGRYRANIGSGKKKIYLGMYATKEEAAAAYNEGAKRFHGEFASLNNL